MRKTTTSLQSQILSIICLLSLTSLCAQVGIGTTSPTAQLTVHGRWHL